MSKTMHRKANVEGLNARVDELRASNAVAG
jgi:hypothetical protein